MQHWAHCGYSKIKTKLPTEKIAYFGDLFVDITGNQQRNIVQFQCDIQHKASTKTVFDSNVTAHKRKTAYKSISSDINEILPFV